MKQFQNYIKEVVRELRKVTWPTYEELKGSTVVVIVFSLIAALYVLGVDLVLTLVLTDGLDTLMSALG
jgi:preprotein translocase subunit SecE